MPETNVCIDCAIEFKADNSLSNIHTYHDIDPREYEIEFELDKIKYDVDFLLIRSIALCRHIQKVFEVIEESASSQTLRHLSAYKHSGKCDEDWCIYAWNDKDEWIAEISRYDTVWEFDSKKELKEWLEARLKEYEVPKIILDYVGIKAQFDCFAVLNTYNSKKYAFFGTADKFLQRYKEEIRFEVLCLSDDMRCNEDVNEKQYIQQRKDRLLKLYRDCKAHSKTEVFFHDIRENLIVDLAVGNVQYHFGKDAMDQMENCARYEIIIVRDGHSIARTKYVHKQADIYLINKDYAGDRDNKDGEDVSIKADVDPNVTLGNRRTAFIVGSSGFHLNEFRDSLKIDALCKVLVDHGYSSNTQSQINTIEWLNDVLIRTDLYYVITRGKSCQPPSKRIKSLKIDYEKSNMNADLVKLNRILLEEFYPQETPKSLIIAVQNGYKDIVELLIKAGADPNAHFNNGETALMAAAEKGHTDIVELLIMAGTDLNAKGDFFGSTALMSAAQNGHKDIVELLIKAGADLNAKGDGEETALMVATRSGHKGIVELLIKAGAVPNAKSNSGKTALISAAQRGHGDIVELLLNAGADPNATVTNEKTALMSAAAAGNKDIVELLIRAGVDINAKGYNGGGYYVGTALISAAKAGHNDIAELLIKAGADVNVKIDSGRTSLMTAATNGHKTIVELLIKSGADPNTESDNGWTALMAACVNGHTDIADLLIQADANINAKLADGRTVLMYAAAKGKKDIAELLINAGAAPNAKDNKGWTALMFAACKGQRDVAELIINAIPDPKAKRISSMGTAAKRYKDIAELLIKAGADPNAKSDNGVTALIAASAKGQHYIAELLIKAGVDPNAKTNKGGNTALDYALNAGFYVIAELLRDYK